MARPLKEETLMPTLALERSKPLRSTLNPVRATCKKSPIAAESSASVKPPRWRLIRGAIDDDFILFFAAEERVGDQAIDVEDRKFAGAGDRPSQGGWDRTEFRGGVAEIDVGNGAACAS